MHAFNSKLNGFAVITLIYIPDFNTHIHHLCAFSPYALHQYYSIRQNGLIDEHSYKYRQLGCTVKYVTLPVHEIVLFPGGSVGKSPLIQLFMDSLPE